MQTLELKSIIWKEGLYYVARCLNVDISSFGETKKEALKNLEEALELYFDDHDEKKINEVAEPEIFNTFLKRA